MGNDFKIASPDSLMDIPVGSVILVGSKWEEEEAWDDSSPWIVFMDGKARAMSLDFPNSETEDLDWFARWRVMVLPIDLSKRVC